MATQISFFPLTGGEDLTTPKLSLKPGELSFSSNYEEDRRGGYRRVDGYERFDGRPLASEASYWVLNFNNCLNVTGQENDTVIGVTSGAQGKLLLNSIITSILVAGPDTLFTGYMILTDVTGTFLDTEALAFLAFGDGFGIGFSNGFG